MKRSNFGRNIREIRQDRGLTQAEFAEKIGLTQTSVAAWEARGIKPRTKEIEQSIYDAFGVDERDLYGFIDGYYSRKYGLDKLKQMVVTKQAFLPLMGRVHAGEAQTPEVLDDSIPVPATVAEAHPNAYFLEVEGSCMSKVYPEGCYILVDPDKAPSNGSIAVVSIDGEDYVMRRLYKGATSLILAPESYEDTWEDIVIKGDEHTVELIGTVVWYQPEKELE